MPRTLEPPAPRRKAKADFAFLSASGCRKLPAIRLRMKTPTVRLAFRLALSGMVFLFAVLFFFYPAAATLRLALDASFRRTGDSPRITAAFTAVAARYESWAHRFLQSRFAATLDPDNVAATEWPMFGSVFFLVTADDLHRHGRLDASRGPLRRAVDRAAAVIVAPDTAAWVRQKWGPDYLERENLFYRMLLILGLSSYENITGDERHHEWMSRQRSQLAAELSAAPLHLLDDYPGECYPNDILWAVAAIQRAARLDATHHDSLARGLMSAFDGPLRAPEDLPSFQVDARTGRLLQPARGCGNSGILIFAPELDSVIASKWYQAYETRFWKTSAWLSGFTEMPLGCSGHFQDVDSGPVWFGLGSVASAFGIGAARAAGRLDHAVPLALEAFACSWPTPFGSLLPGLMGKLAADAPCLGDVALLFSLTRPVGPDAVPFTGPLPRVVWLLPVAWTVLGLGIVAAEILGLRREWRRQTRVQ